MNAFFDSLGRRWAEAAAARGSRIDAPRLEPDVADELLQLARVVAHGTERSFAPLACFTAGVAAERLRAASGAGADVRGLIRTVREALEAELPRGPHR